MLQCFDVVVLNVRITYVLEDAVIVELVNILLSLVSFFRFPFFSLELEERKL